MILICEIATQDWTGSLICIGYEKTESLLFAPLGKQLLEVISKRYAIKMMENSTALIMFFLVMILFGLGYGGLFFSIG